MAYSLSTHYAGQGLLDSFSFFTGEELSNGFVDYKSREEATASNLVSVDNFNRVKLGVDSVNTYSTSDKGRPSVRITSNDAFTHGLFIADFAHMPGSICGTWPAFWAFNNEANGWLWPIGGEIDIIEGANTAQRNLFSAHTTPGCQAPRTGFTGTQGTTDCSLSPGNLGCGYAAPVSDSASYGDAFNAEGGGVYALEWDSQDIKIWHFPRTAIPDDIQRAPITTPDPANWGPPQALFGGSSCEPDSHFFNMSLAIETNLCGAYAGNIWGFADECNELAPTCEEYVAGNPESFANAFWQINYIDIYQKPAPTNSTSPPPFPRNTTLPTPLFPTATSPPVFGNGTALISKTRTVTVTTITQVISTAAPNPTQPSGKLADPATIDGWALLGCFGTLGSYKSFAQIASSPAMDNEACVASCAGRKYAGVSGETCYCADSLSDAHAIANDMCTIPCPGNPHEICGGILPPSAKTRPLNTTQPASHPNTTFPAPNSRLAPFLRRDAASNILLTVYGKISSALPPSAPGMGGIASTRDREGEGDGEGELEGGAKGVEKEVEVLVPSTSAVTVTFTTICPTDAAHLITLEYHTTLTGQPCSLRAATVPMTTCTETCAACGPRGESTVTLTVPEAVVAAETGGGHGVVVAVAVQTVVPVVASSNASSSFSSSSPLNTSSASPSSISATDIPVVGAGNTTSVGRTAGFLRTLGYGLVLWFVVFWVGIIL
ncbi:glycoside hydrolase family 16 protein [Xylaria cf. heliscus]|nr:glycoside hydrolase family 16 protein [Xylaria cf. heliscus]